MGSFLFMLVIFMIIVGIVATMYSRRGSGITERPHGGDQGAPGADRPTEFQNEAP